MAGKNSMAGERKNRVLSPYVGINPFNVRCHTNSHGRGMGEAVPPLGEQGRNGIRHFDLER